jgi:hypothetical protein
MVPPRDGCQAPDSELWLLRKENWICGMFVGKKIAPFDDLLAQLLGHRNCRVSECVLELTTPFRG